MSSNMSAVVRMALGLEYDGSGFHGWQRQSALASVQETLETALSTVACHTVHTTCAGRTDTGVHACQQVVHFDTSAIRSERAWVYGSNTELTHGLRVLWAQPVPFDFDARRSAIGRRYRYVIYNHAIRPGLLREYVSWYYRHLDAQKMFEAAQHWIGEHDFSSFRAAQCQSKSPIRDVRSIQVTRLDDKIVVDVRANAFLHHMIRNMAGVLLSIGAGLAPIEWAKEVLEAKDRRKAGLTASPKGLYLVTVEYPEHFSLPTQGVGPWFLNAI
jgi:tRNA pseudouridine38-40 synthase